MGKDELSIDPFEELKAAEARMKATAGKNIWGRKLQTRPDWTPARPPREERREERTMGRRSALTPEQQDEIKRTWSTVGPTALARKYGVSVSLMYNFGQRHGLSCHGKRPGRKQTNGRTPEPSAKEQNGRTPAAAEDRCESVAVGSIDLGSGAIQTIQVTLRLGITVEVVSIKPVSASSVLSVPSVVKNS